MCFYDIRSALQHRLSVSVPPASSQFAPTLPSISLPNQQTLPQCVPGGLAPRSRQPSWSLPRAPRSCRLSLLSLLWPRVLPASLLDYTVRWMECVCVCVFSATQPTPLKDQRFGQLAWQVWIQGRSMMAQWSRQAVMSLTVCPCVSTDKINDSKIYKVVITVSKCPQETEEVNFHSGSVCRYMMSWAASIAKVSHANPYSTNHKY